MFNLADILQFIIDCLYISDLFPKKHMIAKFNNAYLTCPKRIY